MNKSVAQSRRERLDQLAHDLNECLHVIAMATLLLKEAPNDQSQLESICNSLDNERRRASDLVQELLDAVKNPE